MRRMLLLFVPLVVTACSGAEPDIGSRLPSNIEQGRRIFDARVKARFPVGTADERVRRALDLQGFEIRAASAGVRYATFTADSPAHDTVWTISWRAEAGRVSEIAGLYGVRSL